VPLRMIRNRRLPSSSSISRTRTRSATRTAWRDGACRTRIQTVRHVTTERRFSAAALDRAREGHADPFDASLWRNGR
jgi:hypothetical protein